MSTLYPQPSWQNGLISGQTSWRMNPDVSFTASADHDGYLVCTQNFPDESPNTPTNNPGTTCVDGFRLSSGGNLTVFGGTSASAQVFGGMLTLLVQGNGKQGNFNPTLYALAAKSPTAFHDVTTGNNIVPCPTPVPPATAAAGCVDDTTPPSGYTTAGYYTMGYSAATGYDLVTGLGSIDGGLLFTAMTGGGSAGGPSTYAVTPTPNLNPVSLTAGGTPQAISLGVTSTGFTGTVAFTASVFLLNGTPTSLVTATVTQSPVTLSGNGATGTAMLTITTTASAANRAPAVPWKSGGAIVFAALLGAPFTLRRSARWQCC